MSEGTQYSKALRKYDESAFQMHRRVFGEDAAFGFNVDMMFYVREQEKFVLLEYLLCEEEQDKYSVNPWTSHPNRYFHHKRGGRPGNRQKFITIERLRDRLNASTYYVNYAKEGTKHEDKVLLMRHIRLDPEDKACPILTEDQRMTFSEYSVWLRDLSAAARGF